MSVSAPQTTYVLLLRGINVGGKNKVLMAELRECLQELGFASVRTYIASGNVIVRSSMSQHAIKSVVERALPQRFALDSAVVQAHVLAADELRAVVERCPEGFGAAPETYHSDVIFLMGVTATDAFAVFSPREGVDRVWPGDGVIYSQRVSAERTRSRLSKIASSSLYASMTIRSWSTTTKLVDMLDE